MDRRACSLTMYYIGWSNYGRRRRSNLSFIIGIRLCSATNRLASSVLIRYRRRNLQCPDGSDASLLSTHGYGRGRVELWSEVQKNFNYVLAIFVKAQNVHLNSQGRRSFTRLIPNDRIHRF